MKTIEELNDCLSALGTTKDEIKASLVAAGIKGRKGNADCCPVARHLKQAGFTFPCVGHVAVYAEDHLKVSTPTPVKEFLIGFDRSEYPELDEEVKGSE